MLGYAIGSLGTGVFSTVPTVLLLYYCTETLRIPAATAASIVFLPKAWAIVWDPVVGAWSDRFRSPRGRRAPFIFVGAIGVALTFALIFHAPDASPTTSGIFVAAAYFVMASAYSVFAVPYVAIPSEITDVASERERLMAWRMGCAMLGVLTGAGIAPMLVARAGGGRGGYASMSVMISIVCGLAMFTTYVAVRRYHREALQPPEASASLVKAVRRVFVDADYRRLWWSYLFTMSGAGALIALMPYFVTQHLGRSEEDTGKALFALLTGTIISIPFWTIMLRRFGGWRAFGGALVAFAAIALTFLAVPTTLSFPAFIAMLVVLGVPFAGMQLLPFTLLAHLAHASSGSGARQEGLYTGIWTAGEKLALAIGPAVGGLGLSLAGYVSGAPHQTAHTLRGLTLLFALSPAVLLLPALVLLARRATPRTEIG